MTKNNSAPQLLGRQAAADYLGISRRTLLTWEREGFGPKPGRTPRGAPFYTRKQLDDFVAQFPETAA
jgi:hypothetical protein